MSEENRSRYLKKTRNNYWPSVSSTKDYSRPAGLYSSLNWTCKRCGNINWPKRKSCNICGSKKDTSPEIRTGACGGYNERINIEYKRNRESDSDDEYDKYGRKRKRKNNNHDDGRINDNNNDDDYNSSDNQHSDSDNCDSDKYDLSSFLDDQTKH
ncbi:hypothetical protein O3M35_012884 [Rhynocoris fuscipes]|uniref:RanBP2-type domain-containing protein n=1 Tax=Rhynocoris fuscipes TaxID=488301 RepID=A0AAW1CHQ4_9HEMI